MRTEPLDVLPLWFVFLLTAGVVVSAIETGFRLGRRRRVRAVDEKEASIGSIVGAMLGLLAFLLAFTFGLAASRFDDRRHGVLDEANSIGTTWLRAAMLPEPQQSDARRLLRDYVDVRLEGADPATIEKSIARSEAIHEQLWSIAVSASGQNPTPITALFVQSLNETIDLHAKRLMMALHSRIPSTIWISLFVVTFLSMGVVGYFEGITSRTRSPVAIPLILTFSTVITLIADLDRPGQGLLRVGQQSMQDLRDSLRESSQAAQDHQP